MRIYPRVLRPIGPSREYTRARTCEGLLGRCTGSLPRSLRRRARLTGACAGRRPRRVLSEHGKCPPCGRARPPLGSFRPARSAAAGWGCHSTTQHSALNSQHTTACSTHNTTQHAQLATQHSTLNSQHSTARLTHNTTQHAQVTTQYSTLNSQHNTTHSTHNTTQHAQLATQHSTLNSQHNTAQLTRNTAQHAQLTTQYSTLNSQHNTARLTHNTAQHAQLTTQHSTLNSQHSTARLTHNTIQHAQVTTQYSTLNSQHNTAEHSTNPRDNSCTPLYVLFIAKICWINRRPHLSLKSGWKVPSSSTRICPPFPPTAMWWEAPPSATVSPIARSEMDTAVQGNPARADRTCIEEPTTNQTRGGGMCPQRGPIRREEGTCLTPSTAPPTPRA
eukprot:9480337-Pyramimonas_sp.AAC.1